jgi:hypothetical protein
MDRSAEHRPDLVVEGLIVQVVDLDGLEVFFGIEVTLGDQEGLPQNQFFNLGVVVVHDIVVGVSFFRAFEELGDLLGRQFLSFSRRRLVVHHFVQLGQGFRVVLV